MSFFSRKCSSYCFYPAPEIIAIFWAQIRQPLASDCSLPILSPFGYSNWSIHPNYHFHEIFKEKKLINQLLVQAKSIKTPFAFLFSIYLYELS